MVAGLQHQPQPNSEILVSYPDSERLSPKTKISDSVMFNRFLGGLKNIRTYQIEPVCRASQNMY
jgi:hypothetical protein